MCRTFLGCCFFFTFFLRLPLVPLGGMAGVREGGKRRRGGAVLDDGLPQLRGLRAKSSRRTDESNRLQCRFYQFTARRLRSRSDRGSGVAVQQARAWWRGRAGVMCILAVASRPAAPLFSFVCAHNRDETLSRQ